jgi:hypothetical protein
MCGGLHVNVVDVCQCSGCGESAVGQTYNSILNIITVIPTMDHIDEVLATNAFDTQYSLSIQATLTMGKKTLNCYYSKTDPS